MGPYHPRVFLRSFGNTVLRDVVPQNNAVPTPRDCHYLIQRQAPGSRKIDLIPWILETLHVADARAQFSVTTNTTYVARVRIRVWRRRRLWKWTIRLTCSTQCRRCQENTVPARCIGYYYPRSSVANESVETLEPTDIMAASTCPYTDVHGKVHHFTLESPWICRKVTSVYPDGLCFYRAVGRALDMPGTDLFHKASQWLKCEFCLRTFLTKFKK